MKQSETNRVVTFTYIVEDDADAQQLVDEITEVSALSGHNLLYSGVDKPEDHHEETADELGVYGDQ
jgi:hypothetical protein